MIMEAQRRDARPLIPPVGGPLPEATSVVRRKLREAYQASRDLSPRKLKFERRSFEEFLVRYQSQYKRRMILEMRGEMLASPIPTTPSFRIGSGRVVPLYESERLINRMEKVHLSQPERHV